jgi:hypothetical protein
MLLSSTINRFNVDVKQLKNRPLGRGNSREGEEEEEEEKIGAPYYAR